MAKRRKTTRKASRKATRRKTTRRKVSRRKTKASTTRRKTSRKKSSGRKTTRKKAAPKKAGKRRKSGLTSVTCSCSPALQKIVGSGRMTRPQIVKKLWAYIKRHKCQDLQNRRKIVPDSNLSAVIGKNPIDMLKLAGCISKHVGK